MMLGTVAPAALLRRLASALRRGSGFNDEDLRPRFDSPGGREAFDDFISHGVGRSATGSSGWSPMPQGRHGGSGASMGDENSGCHDGPVVAWGERSCDLATCANDRVDGGSTEAGIGVVLVGRQRRVGGVNQPSTRAPQGFRDVVVDRHASGVGNPFVGGSTAVLCRAYSLLLIVLLLMDEGRSIDDAVWWRLQALPPPEGAMELEMTRRIAAFFAVRVHPWGGCRSASFMAAWLWHHARMVAGGQCLRLLCWCCSQGVDQYVSQGSCHAVELAIALRWLARGLMATHDPGDAAPTLSLAAAAFTQQAAPLVRLALASASCSNRAHGALRLRDACLPAAGSSLSCPMGAQVEDCALPGSLHLPAELWKAGPPSRQRQPSHHNTCDLPPCLLVGGWPHTRSHCFRQPHSHTQVSCKPGCWRSTLGHWVVSLTSLGAVTLVYSTPAPAHSQVLAQPHLMCGDWAMADIFSRWPHAVAKALASFHWPLTTLEAVSRLLRCSQIGVLDVVVCEFSGAVRSCNERVYGRPTLSLDLRASLVPGVHACVDARLVIPLRRSWNRVYAFPPCTHQTLSDTTSSEEKQMDGRTFWGIMFFLWCWCIPCSTLMLEHPDTVVPDFFQQPTQRFRTSQLGCVDDKRINLYERRRQRLTLTEAAGGTSGHRRLHDFANADERDRHRSSWARFPQLVEAVVSAGIDPLDSVGTPVLAEVVEAFAVAWYRSRRNVPWDYQSPDAQPSTPEARAYQFVRGKGDGRRPDSTVPASLVGGDVIPFEDAMLVARLVSLTALVSHSFVLMFVAIQTVPLVFASLNGVEVVGVQFQVPTHRRLALTIASRWADAAISDRSSTFLVGEYGAGVSLFTSPLDLNPPRAQVARTPSQRRRMFQAGVAAAWCTVAALAGTVVYDPAARAAAACSALRCPVPHMVDAVALGHRRLETFTVGAFSTRPMLDRLTDLPTVRSAPELALARMAEHALALTRRLRAQGDEESVYWSDVIRPEELQDVPPGFFDALPTFSDARLDLLPLVDPPKPKDLARLLLRPVQPPAPSGRCPRSPLDLMTPSAERRYRSCMDSTLADLVCIREQGEDCERQRPHTCVFGQADLWGWARSLVWDFRRSPQECASPLDYRSPLNPTLNADFFERELRDYPNQRILGMIVDGVIYQADVELQTIFVPHLTSLPKGFGAVSKELKRLAAKGWYEFYAHPPFWPGYFNGQGTQARKLELNRPRRTTEGGWPRKETADRSGLRVWPINEASKVYHVPQHYARDERPEMAEWMASRGLPPSQEQLDQLSRSHGTKWGKHHMPTLRDVMQDVATLSRTARRLGMPIYVMGNDVKDYFNHLENAASELPLMNIAWIDDGDLEADARQRAYSDAAGNRLVFVSERRMGFGIHPNAAIAQEMSEAIDHIYRRRLDAKLDARLAASTDPDVLAWRQERLKLQSRVGGHQTRMYAAHTYIDDNLVVVVGVDNALDALETRGEIEREAGLIMAIPEKRMLGTWGLWLGIYIFAGLGLVVIPRSKLVRATSALRLALAGNLQFDDYQSLMGLLEHIRHASCWPRSIMHGLYRPHGPEGEGRHGPATLVRPTYLMANQLVRWLNLLTRTAGAAVTDAVRRSSLPRVMRALTYVGSSDAATDSSPPGLGGYMHGLFWYLQLTALHIHWLHISVLEMLATGFSTIIFQAQLPPGAELVLGADATATATSLTLHSQRSEMLMTTDQELLGNPAFDEARRRTSLGHLRGDANEAADAVSRAKWETFHALCKRLRIRPTQLAVPDDCHAILSRVLQAAMDRGVPVRPNPYVAAPLDVPDSHAQYLPSARGARRVRGASPARRGVHALELEQSRGASLRGNDMGDGPHRKPASDPDAEIYAALVRLYRGVRQQRSHQELAAELVAVVRLGGGTQPRPSTLDAIHAVADLQVAAQSGSRLTCEAAAFHRGAAIRTVRLWLSFVRTIESRVREKQARLFALALACALQQPHSGVAGPSGVSDMAGPSTSLNAGHLAGEPAGLSGVSTGAGACQLAGLPESGGLQLVAPCGVGCGPPEHHHGWAYPTPAETCYRCGSHHVVECAIGAGSQYGCGATFCLPCHGGNPPPLRGPAIPVPVLCCEPVARTAGALALEQARGVNFRGNDMGDGPLGDVTFCGIKQHGLGMHQRFIARWVLCESCQGAICSWCRAGCKCRHPHPHHGGWLPDDVEDEDDPAPGDDLTPNVLPPATRAALRVRGGAPSRSVAQPGDLVVVIEMNLANPDDLVLDESDLVHTDDLVLTDADLTESHLDDLVLTESDIEGGGDEVDCSCDGDLTTSLASVHLGTSGSSQYAPPWGFVNAHTHFGPDGPVQLAPAFGPGVALAPPRSLRCLELERMLAASQSCNSLGDGPGAFAAAKQRAELGRPRTYAAGRAPSRFWLATHVAPVTEEPRQTRNPTPYAEAVHDGRRKQKSVTRMPTVTVGGEVFAAPASRRERATSIRKLSMLQLAGQRAGRLASSAANEVQRENLADAVRATHDLAEFGAAAGTLDIDDHAYLFWERFCNLYGWSPTFGGDAEWVRTHQDEVTQRLAIFQSWVYPQLSGRGGRADAKPRTVFNNYVLAIIRLLSREHLPMPKAKHIEKSLAGLMRSFKLIYGVEHLMPGRKQPFTPAMWSRIESLPEGHRLPGRSPWSPRGRFRDRTILRLGRVLWRTGHRMGEIVFHPSGEINYLTRKCVSIRKASGRAIPVPTMDDWRGLSVGDVVWLAPCPSKADQFGEEHCPYPSVLPYDGKENSAAAAVRDIELELPCRPEDRESTPLFCDGQGSPLTYAVMHRELRALLGALYGERFAEAFSWHSIRIGLACSLHAAGCPDAIIQLICRWASPSSLRIYRQMGVNENVSWTDQAQHVEFDAARVNNIPALDNDDRMQRNIAEFAGMTMHSPGDVPAAQTPRRTIAPPTPQHVPAQAYAIHGGSVMATTHDGNGLVGLDVGVYNNYWPGYSRGRTSCRVVARCLREFRHPDGVRGLAYLFEYNNEYWPIKHSALLECLTQEVRRALPPQACV